MHGCMYVNLRKCIHTGVDMSPVRGLRHPGTACAAPPDPPRAVSIPVRALVGEWVGVQARMFTYMRRRCTKTDMHCTKTDMHTHTHTLTTVHSVRRHTCRCMHARQQHQVRPNAFLSRHRTAESSNTIICVHAFAVYTSTYLVPP